MAQRTNHWYNNCICRVQMPAHLLYAIIEPAGSKADDALPYGMISPCIIRAAALITAAAAAKKQRILS